MQNILIMNLSSFKCPFICFMWYYSIVCLDSLPHGGAFLTLLIDVSFLPPRGVYIDRCITSCKHVVGTQETAEEEIHGPRKSSRIC